MARENKAFTLVELQMASVIALITLLAIMSLYTFSWKNFTIGNNILDVYSNSRNAAGWLTRDIRSAAQIISSYSSYTTTDNRIVFTVPSIDSSGNVISSHYDYFVYQLAGTNLWRTIVKDGLSVRRNETNRIIARYCSSLIFSTWDPLQSKNVTMSKVTNLSTINTVAIYLPINKSTISLGGGGGEIASINPTTIIRLRNK